jgi:multiple sugar transport system ATP-binding protein
MSLVSKTELEALRWLRDTAPKNPIRFEAEVLLSEALGNETLITSSIGDEEFVTRMLDPRDVADGERMSFALDTDRIHLFDPETERSLRKGSDN